MLRCKRKCGIYVRISTVEEAEEGYVINEEDNDKCKEDTLES